MIDSWTQWRFTLEVIVNKLRQSEVMEWLFDHVCDYYMDYPDVIGIGAVDNLINLTCHNKKKKINTGIHKILEAAEREGIITDSDTVFVSVTKELVFSSRK